MDPGVGYLKTTPAAMQSVKRGVATVLFCLAVLVAGSLQLASASGPASVGTLTAEWGNTIAVTTLGGRLYSIEKSGALYQTDLATGKWVQIGKPEFARTAFLFADDRNLYTIDFDGTLYRVSPSNGTWNRVGQAGEWKNTGAAVTLNNNLFSIERSGALFRTDLSTGRWVQLGKAEYGNTRFIFADGQSLYTIEADGSMYRVNPTNGSWSGVGTAGAWRNTIAGTTFNGRIYSVEQTGALYETNPATGAWKQIGKAEFGKTKFMFGDGEWLYSIDAGVLYRISPSDGSWTTVARSKAIFV